MRKLRYTKRIHPVNQQRLVILIPAIIIIMIGILFAAVNIFGFIKGYNAGRVITQPTKISSSNVNLKKSGDFDSLDKLLSGDKAKEDLYSERPATGDELGELYIPKLDKALPIYEGTKEEELEKGVGHYAGSVLPGEEDNCVLSGHRDTVFRKLGEIGEGDFLIVRTAAGEFQYKVTKVRIVNKDDRTVIVPKPDATLTVSTCYPFSYIGAAPKRYVLVAYLYSETLK